MYRCYECGSIFSEPEDFSEDKTPGGVFEGGSFIDHCTGCPMCSGNYGEVQECDICGEWIYVTDIIYCSNGSLCEDCYYNLEANSE